MVRLSYLNVVRRSKKGVLKMVTKHMCFGWAQATIFFQKSKQTGTWIQNNAAQATKRRDFFLARDSYETHNAILPPRKVLPKSGNAS
jgi:hypothetical protein